MFDYNYFDFEIFTMNLKEEILKVVIAEKKSFCEYLLDEIQSIIENGDYDSRTFIAIVTLLNSELEKMKK